MRNPWWRALFWLLLIAGQGLRGLTVNAAPPIQGPTRAPYVFPTPIFIPYDPGDDAPQAKTVPRPSATPAAGSQSRGERTYTVVKGDSPWIISQKVYGSGARFKAILEANDLSESAVLKVGSVLRIPAVDASGRPILVTLPTKPAGTVIASGVTPTSQIWASDPITVSTSAISKKTTGEPNVAELLINLVAFLLLVGSAVLGGLAYTLYRRSARTKKVETLAKRVRSTK